MALIVVCGSRGQGKTTWLREYMADMAQGGRTIGGLAAPAVFIDGRRIGYDVVDFRHGTRRPLAREVTAVHETPTIGAYRFDEAALAEGNAAIIAAVQDGLDIIAIDEVGPLELEGGGWAPALTFALRTCTPRQELVIAVRTSLADRLPARFPSSLWPDAKRVFPPTLEREPPPRTAARRSGE